MQNPEAIAPKGKIQSDLSGKRFVASFSSGKDSMLAIYRAIKENIIPLELITTYNTDYGRSWFHGIPELLLEDVARSIGIPLRLVKTKGEEYATQFEKALALAKDNGADLCVFGDIDLVGHLKWCNERCVNSGLKSYFPLWQEDREKLVYDFIDSGFQAVIKVVNTSKMPARFLGQILTKEVAQEIKASGADMCGENGEYHTFVFDGPIFKYPVKYQVKDKLRLDEYMILALE